MPDHGRTTLEPGRERTTLLVAWVVALLATLGTVAEPSPAGVVGVCIVLPALAVWTVVFFAVFAAGGNAAGGESPEDEQSTT